MKTNGQKEMVRFIVGVVVFWVFCVSLAVIMGVYFEQ